MRWLAATAAAALLAFPPAAAVAQTQPSPRGSAEQREAIDALDFLDGEWRGEAVIFMRNGERLTLTQTERVGDLLGGWIKLVEGRGYLADGETAFNALGVIAWDDEADQYRIRTWAQGRGGDYAFARTEDGFAWEIPAGEGAVIRYTAVVRDGVWRQVGEYIREGSQPIRTIEMTLRRVGDSDWPAGGAVAP